MAVEFVPQFFLLMGIDFFLAAAVIATLLEDYYSNASAYAMIAGGFFGFAQLLIGPSYLSDFSEILQFCYCAGFALMALLSLIGLNLYLYLVKKRRTGSGIFAALISIPASFFFSYFALSYLASANLVLPSISDSAIIIICAMIFGSIVVLLAVVIMTWTKMRRRPKSKWKSVR